MSVPSTVVPESFDDNEEELVLVGPDGEEEVLEICKSTDYTWFVEAEQDLVTALRTLEKENPETDEPSDESTSTLPAEADIEDECDFSPENRSASYGQSWEEDPLSDWMPEKILKRHARKGVCSYLVKWKSHHQPTWELEEDLFEEGHSGMIAAFNRSRRESNKNPPKKEGDKAVGQKKPLYRLLKYMLFDPKAYWRDFQNRIESRFRLAGMQAMTIYNVCNAELASAFTKHWLTETPDSVPVMVFHGTALTNIESIVTGGLRIPNQGENPVKVANGSVHGIGIYTSINPSVCISYSRNSGYIIVCAGLTSGHFASYVKTPGDFVVFFDERLLLPCFLVAFERTVVSGNPAVYKQNIDQETLTSYNQIQPVVSHYQNYTTAMLISRYKQGLLMAGQQQKNPRTIRSGATEGVHKYEKGKRTLTKKELRAAPKSAKQAYKAGLLLQPRK
eukprot:TRINITY_DN7933_c3_g2_i1.p1 TRINITY_DN7933_c3_g2~~TRINITY_DN7933_c3_g2_i1.p1  ORF type:complete len:448 (+),score=65.83 TRINITY_DN7933_c3_g2_i1:53-1396(+)